MSIGCESIAYEFDLDELKSNVGGIEIPEVVHSGWLGRFFPFGFWYEFRMLIRLAIPITITSLIAFMSGPISVIFCGRLGKTALATVGLAVSIFNVTGLSVITGLLSAADTLFAQTYGGAQKRLMGVHLQRSFVIITFCCLPCVTIHLLAEPLLISLRQNPMVSKAAAEYLLYMIPGLFFAAYNQLLTKYVQTQNRVYPPLIIGLCGNALNALLHYILLFVVKIGVRGSAIAQVSSYLSQCILLLLFIIWMERTSDTWQGWSREMWAHWGVWFQLAMPGVFMTTLEWTIFEIGSIVSGTLGEKELATQAILFNIEAMCYTLLPLGFGIATSIRLGQFLGAGSSVGPQSVLSVALVTLWSTSLIFIVVIVTLRWEIPKIFTQDEGVIELSASLLPLIAAFQIFDGTVGVCSGAIRGAGLQLIGAVVCFVTLYVIGAPLGLCLVFLAGLSLEGLWAGLTLGTVLEGLVYCIITHCISWEKQAQLAIDRTRMELGSVIEVKPKETMSHDTLNPSYNYESDAYETRTAGTSNRTVTEPWNVDVEPKSKYQSTVLIVKRLSFMLILVCLFLGGICTRIFVPWADVIGSFCLLNNGTFFPVSNGTVPLENCTIITV